MRFISISERAQIGIMLLTIAVVSWVGTASYRYVFTSEILANKDREIAAGRVDYQDLDSQFDQMKNDIAKTARSLEQRQVYLQQLLDTDKSLEGPKEEKAPVLPEAQESGKSSSLLKPAFGHEKYLARTQTLKNMKFDLSRIESNQAPSGNRYG